MKFIVTEELGRLAKWLRIIGFDTLYYGKADKRDLVLRSLREDRVIVTRNSAMSRFTGVRLLRLDTDFVEEQLERVLKGLNINVDRERLFSLCVVCNEKLEEADRESVKEQVAPYVFETQKAFMRCPACGRIYWKGTHWALVNRFLDKIKA